LPKARENSGKKENEKGNLKRKVTNSNHKDKKAYGPNQRPNRFYYHRKAGGTQEWLRKSKCNVQEIGVPVSFDHTRRKPTQHTKKESEKGKRKGKQTVGEGAAKAAKIQCRENTDRQKKLPDKKKFRAGNYGKWYERTD